MASQEIEALVQALSKLPGLGPRSARRAVLHLMKRREGALLPLVRALEAVEHRLVTCSTCGNVDTSDPCAICTDTRRDGSALCVVEEVSDLWALDKSRLFPGRYHVLGGCLSALDGIRPEDLNIAGLIERASAPNITEVILAMNATVDGQTTAHYIADEIGVLHRQGLIQMHLGAQLGDLFHSCIWPQRDTRRIARNNPRNGKDQHRDADQNHQRNTKPPQQQAQNG